MVKRFGLLGFVIAAGLLAGGSVLIQAGLCFNPTLSMPVGLYQKMSRFNPLKRGMLVLFCPPESLSFTLAIQRHYLSPGGACPQQVQPLLKPVVAVAGDTVQVSPTGIVINGTLLAHSKALSKDSQGITIRSVPQGTYSVKPGEIWVISTHSPKSFDSRYFGPVLVQHVQWIARPLLTGE